MGTIGSMTGSENSIVERARTSCAGRPLTIVFPEGDDERICGAAARVLASCPDMSVRLIGKETARHTALRDAYPADRLQVIDPDSNDKAEELAAAYASGRPDNAATLARRFVRKPMYLSGLMLKTGRADAMVAGVTCPTARVIEAAMLTVGLADGVSVPSSYFMMHPGGFATGPVLFSDCAVNISPSSEDLASIAVASARSWETLMGSEPRVAFLSFSTHGSANHAEARKVREAADLAARLCPHYRFDGELQADAALNPRVAALKAKGQGGVAGQANVLVFPDLNAANIGYKLVQQLGGATAIGPFLQGFAAPVSDLSRGATVDEIAATAIVTASLAAPRGAAS